MSPSPTAELHTGAIEQPEPVKLQTLQTAQPSASQPMSKFAIPILFGALPVSQDLKSRVLPEPDPASWTLPACARMPALGVSAVP